MLLLRGCLLLPEWLRSGIVSKLPSSLLYPIFYQNQMSEVHLGKAPWVFDTFPARLKSVIRHVAFRQELAWLVLWRREGEIHARLAVISC
jgi:hypothetical protein